MTETTANTSGHSSIVTRALSKPRVCPQREDEHGKATESMADIANVLTELRALRADFGCELDTTNSHLGDMNNSISASEQSMVEVRNTVESNKTRVTEAEERISTLEDDLEVAKADLAIKRSTLESKTDELENRGRRKNLRLFGLRERAENNQPLLEYVEQLLPRWLGCHDKTFTLERAHRTLSKPKPGQNRGVIIRFLKFQDREFVINTAKKLNIQHEGNKLLFVPDLSTETLRQRNEFNTVRQKFVEKGLYRGFQIHPCRMRVLHESKMQLFATPREAEFYQKII
ncbi:unnamed protein product [Knipowitschia caucasica]|uniref:LINE-1 type transposase domain-containing 1 n=1 Tax=Knipowitschia caucasica TaxID=637954 RepID=A0AAV2LUD7_KNICA